MRLAKTVGTAALLLTLLVGRTVAAQTPRCSGGLTPPPGGCLPGFPKSLAGAGLASSWRGHPVIADLGLLAGHKQIVFATTAGKLWAVNDDGSIPFGFPLTIPGNASVLSGPAVGDVDGDGKPDIVVAWGTPPQGPNPPGGFGAYKNNGPGSAFTLLWQRTTKDLIPDGVPDGAISTPAIGDVDGDGRNEVVVGTLDQHIYVVNGLNGTDKPGWPFWVGDTIWSSPALADLDGDGKLEVIIGSDSHDQPTGLSFSPTTAGGLLFVLNSSGALRPGFPIQYDQVIASAPVVGDIDGDGRPEIVFGTGSFFAVPQSSHRVYAVHCDGTTVAGWPVQVDGQVSTSPALADLDGDGIVDVVVTDDNTGPSKTFHVYAFKGKTGALLWSGIPKGHFGETLSAGDPVIADVLAGGPLSGKEVLVPENAEIVVFDAMGTQLTSNGAGAFNLYAEGSVTGVAVDVSGGVVEIVTTTGDASNTIVAAWKGTGSTTQVPWGMVHRDAAANGLAPNAGCCPLTPTATNTGPYCIGSTISLSTPAVLGATYSWTGPNGFTSAVRNPTIPNATAANAGTYSVKVTTVAGCASALGTTNVVVNSLAAPAVTAPSTVMAGSPNWTANVPAHAGSTYAWEITNGTITAGQGTNQITFTAGTTGTPLTLSVTETAAPGCVSATGTATITVAPAGPTGFFYTVDPCRRLDTRSGSPISPGGTLAVALIGAPCGIPSGATSVSVNAVATQETASGHLTIYPADKTQPLVSSINFNAGQTRPNNAVLSLSRDGTGRVNIYNGSGGTVHVVIDVNGYFQ
jgi:FG-GAP-like repeat/PKD-like domain